MEPDTPPDEAQAKDATAAQSAEEVVEPTAVETGEDLAGEVASLRKSLVERTNDLKRLQAEYVNYKRRVDRDRDVARNAGIEQVIVDLGGVLDTIRIAQEHEEMTGGFKLLIDELGKITTKYGLETFGEKGELFDPQMHDALMQAPMPGVTEPTVLDVMQVGYRFKGRVLRAARVAVGMPTEEAPPAAGAPGEDAPAE